VQPRAAGSSWISRFAISASTSTDKGSGGADAGRRDEPSPGYQKHEIAGNGTGNSRNGKSLKTLKGEAGEMTIDVPRDRNGTFEPQLIEKHQTRFEGFDAKILSMYAPGMTVRDIQGHLRDMYGVDVSTNLIPEVTDSIQEEVKA